MDRVVQISWHSATGGQGSQEVSLPCIIGRSSDCAVQIDDAQLSRQHFQVLPGPNPQLLQIEDLASANGTQVSGDFITQQVTAQLPVEVVAGDHRFCFALSIDQDQQLLDNLVSQVLNVVRVGVADLNHDHEDFLSQIRQLIEQAINTCQIDSNLQTQVSKIVQSNLIGFGPIDDYILDETISEIMVNGPNDIYIERDGRVVATDRVFADESALRTVIDRIVMPLGRRVDELSPMVDARLADGSRVNAVISPLALNGSTLTIRKFRKKRLIISELIENASMSAELAQILQRAIERRLNIVVSGGTGSGKTTLLNILSDFIPDNERILTIEDSAELQLSQPHLVRLESRPANTEGVGEVSIRDLVRNALRMRPDRIIVGECRGAEALDMLQAMNTGHDGSLTTVHANSPRDAIARIETMCLMADLGLPHQAIREQVVRAVHLIVQQARLANGKRLVTEIVYLGGIEGDTPLLQPLGTYDAKRDIFDCQKILPEVLRP